MSYFHAPQFIVEFACSRCGQRFNARDPLTGYVFVCACGTEYRVVETERAHGAAFIEFRVRVEKLPKKGSGA